MHIYIHYIYYISIIYLLYIYMWVCHDLSENGGLASDIQTWLLTYGFCGIFSDRLGCRWKSNGPSQITEHVVFFNVSLHFTLILNDINVGKTMINHPFGMFYTTKLWWFGGWFIIVLQCFTHMNGFLRWGKLL